MISWGLTSSSWLRIRSIATSAYDDNLKEITARNLHYIVASRQSERDVWLADFEDTEGFEEVIRQPSPRNPFQKKSHIQVKMRQRGGETLVLCLSRERKEKDRAIREKQEGRFLADVAKLEKRVGNGGLAKPVKIGEAIADYDEMRKEVKLGIAECGRRLGILLKRKRKKVAYTKRRDVFTRYIDELVEATRAITVINKEDFRKALVSLSKVYTVQADMEFDEHGKVIKKHRPGNELGLADTVVVDRDEPPPDPQTLFDIADEPKATTKAKKRRTKRAARSRSKKPKRRRR